MTANEIIKKILTGKNNKPACASGAAFAPVNIALCKYWGKRDAELNLPVTSSLSISLGNRGATTTIQLHQGKQDQIFLNGSLVENDRPFSKRLIEFLNLFRPTPTTYFKVEIHSNIPIAAGLASSSCGFASIVLALNELFQWQLTKKDLSILARLGSGSACRSLWHGFVEWQKGSNTDGMDSHGIPIATTWPDLQIGLLLINTSEKPISSRRAMQQTMMTSPFYSCWPNTVNSDLNLLKQALQDKDFAKLGETAESNALALHAIMMATKPPIVYSLPETLNAMHSIWQLRQAGVAIYFTQDAGANLKLLFLETDIPIILEQFPSLEIVEPFAPIIVD